MANRAGENFQERSKGKDVRASNIMAAKVSLVECLTAACRVGTNKEEARSWRTAIHLYVCARPVDKESHQPPFY
jgi:hypothetical protein